MTVHVISIASRRFRVFCNSKSLDRVSSFSILTLTDVSALRVYGRLFFILSSLIFLVKLLHIVAATLGFIASPSFIRFQVLGHAVCHAFQKIYIINIPSTYTLVQNLYNWPTQEKLLIPYRLLRVYPPSTRSVH